MTTDWQVSHVNCSAEIPQEQRDGDNIKATTAMNSSEREFSIPWMLLADKAKFILCFFLFVWSECHRSKQLLPLNPKKNNVSYKNLTNMLLKFILFSYIYIYKQQQTGHPGLWKTIAGITIKPASEPWLITCKLDCCPYHLAVWLQGYRQSNCTWNSITALLTNSLLNLVCICIKRSHLLACLLS